MKNKKIILSFSIFLGLILISIYFNIGNSKMSKNITSSATPYPTLTITKNQDHIKIAAITPSATKNIEVVSPLIGDNVTKNILVKGNAKTAENIVGIRLWDSSGNVIAETTAETNSPSSNQFGPFEKLLNFNTTDTSGELEIFKYDSIDGSITETVEIPLRFDE